MAVCTTCGNVYHNTFTVTWGDKTATFDSLECAITELAPECALCGCRILGHGTEADGRLYCCTHCARQAQFVGTSNSSES
jgi:hypothetical protein